MSREAGRKPAGGRNRVTLTLPFDDIMDFALALLTIEPRELKALGWTFAQRKRFLDHFLASGRAAQGVDPARLGAMPIAITVPRQDLDRMRTFALRELPKAASNAAMIDRVLAVLDEAADRQDREKQPCGRRGG